ncbi:MAG TPA: PHP domain-containing protein [Candidatus Thermoplasmatota archaeon]|nr:PHP domain-containing protein [Candidatus Thermoplasmatota archaeon]
MARKARRGDSAPSSSTFASKQAKPAPDNVVLAQVLEHYAQELEKERANPYRVRAYRKAAKSIGRHPRSLGQMVDSGQPLTSLPNVGPHLESLLVEVLRTGKVPKLKRDKPGSHRHHDGEAKASRAGRTRQGTFIRPILAPFVEALMKDLRRFPGVASVEPAGAYRRRADVVEDLDLVAACKEPGKTMRAWAKGLALPAAADLTSTTVRMTTRDKLPVAVRFATPAQMGRALLESTGSQAHVAQLRGLAKAQRRRWPPAAGEAACYEALGLAFIEPELREGEGEVEAAREGRLPDLVTLADLKGDLHMHTYATDGASSVEAMAKASRHRGLSYVAITDHTQRTSIAGGLTPDEMRKHLAHIAEVNDQAKAERWGITILKGAEVDILRHGLDLPDDVLDELDLVVCSLHHRDRQEGPELTRRTLEAMEHPCAHILGHPTGRMLGRRPPMDLDWDKLLDAALDQGWALEVDGQAYRMDPPHPIIRRAAALGIPFSLSSDAHSVPEMQFQENAVQQARRGWVAKGQVLNAGTLREMKARLRR